MPLINCPECDHRVSDQANACPSCGFPLKETGKPTFDDVTEPQKTTPLIHWERYEQKYSYARKDIDDFINKKRLEGEIKEGELYVIDQPPEKINMGFHRSSGSGTTVADGMRIGVGIIIVLVVLFFLMLVFFGR